MTSPTSRRLAAAVTLSAVVAVLVAVVPANAEPTSAEVTVHRDGGVSYADPGLADAATTTVTGVLSSYVVDEEDSAQPSRSAWVIITGKRAVLPVAIKGDTEDLPTGASVSAEVVKGASLDTALGGGDVGGRALKVASMKVAATSSASTDAAAATAQRAYVAIVANSGTLSSTSTIDNQVDAGLAWWRQEAGSAMSSFARTGSTVSYTSTLSDRCGLDDPGPLWTEAERKFPAVNFGEAGNHLIVVVSRECDGSGIGTVGNGFGKGGYVTLTDASSVFTTTLAHEIGHNFSLEHASQSCTGCEYWDVYSIMGLAVQGYGPTALDSPYRNQLGLVSAGEIETIDPGEQKAVSLNPRSSNSGVRGVEIRDNGTSYWVEWRDGTGRDAGSYYPNDGGTVRVSTDKSFPRGVTIASQASGSSDQIYLQPRIVNGHRYGSWSSGQTFTSDDGKVTVAVGSIADTATVTLTDRATTTPITSTPTAPSPTTASPTTPTTPTTPSPTTPSPTTTSPSPAVPTLQSSSPTLSGAVQVGSRLTARPGSWTSGTVLSYAWTSDTNSKPAGTSSSFVPTAALRGHRLTLCVTGSKSGYQTARRCTGTVTVGYGILAGPTPTIRGTLRVGHTLAVATGAWTPRPALSYQWYGNGKAIRGANHARYTIASSLRGRRLSVHVTGRLTGYRTRSVSSARTGRVR